MTKFYLMFECDSRPESQKDHTFYHVEAESLLGADKALLAHFEFLHSEGDIEKVWSLGELQDHYAPMLVSEHPIQGFLTTQHSQFTFVDLAP